jgi:ribosomal RNA methyltransferase Nop2
MKRKQGMPETLSEEHFANLKRKAGLPADPPVERPAPSNKKRKTVAKKPEPTRKKASAKSNGKAKKLPEPVEDSEDEEMGDEIDLEKLEADGDAPSGEKMKNIWSDEEGGSDGVEEDDSVFDSDDQEESGKKGKFVFSDDEDESDAEETLTAANIVGLSRKLDKKLAEDKAITETEMQESAMQTNIDGPKIFGEGYEDGDDDDDLAEKSQSLLAPDLQLLRQRITDTIRVLDDFSSLSEEGRSRAEYTAQLIKDICAVSFSHYPLPQKLESFLLLE